MWTLQKVFLIGCSVFTVFALGSPASRAADPDNGKTLANRWCSGCHVVQPSQTLATDQAPPFASLARMPDFNESRLAIFLLKPHPNMPSLSLSRAEVADIADYITTLK